VAVALGSVGTTVLRCPEAEAHLVSVVDWAALRCDEPALGSFAELVRTTAQPITDHRSTAGYRRHAVGVLARRLVGRGLDRLRRDRDGVRSDGDGRSDGVWSDGDPLDDGEPA